MVFHSDIVAAGFHTRVDAIEAMQQVVAEVATFCRCGVETKNGRIPAREVLWNLNFGSPVRVTRIFGGLQNH